MDTATHVTMGVGLAGLSFLDPTVASHPEIMTSILFCTIVGSNAPDIDFIYKYQGKEAYVQNHRGMTHSLYGQVILAALIALTVSIVNGGSYFFSFFAWSLLAVVVHVILDICNIYGTQAFRPFTDKWIALNILPIFDPIIFVLHLIGFVLWGAGIHPGYSFLCIYILISLYVLARFLIYDKILCLLKDEINVEATYSLIPTFNVFSWGVICSKNDHYSLGKYEKGALSWSKMLHKKEGNKVIQASMKNKFIAYLLKHSSFLHAKIVQNHNGYEVHWFDLRYQSRIDEPFIAIIYLDTKLNLVKSYVKNGLIPAPEKG